MAFGKLYFFLFCSVSVALLRAYICHHLLSPICNFCYVFIGKYIIIIIIITGI